LEGLRKLKKSLRINGALAEIRTEVLPTVSYSGMRFM
jgi:hypothetical protein